MGALGGEQLLRAWELSRTLPEQEAVLSLLVLVWPERSRNELALLPLGERNAMLLDLHAALFGPRMEGFAICPECTAELEVTSDPRALAQALRFELAEPSQEIAGYRMRPVNSLDLMASSHTASEEEARPILLARSLGLEAHEVAQLGESLSALVEQFERMNASAEIRLRLHCAVCRNEPVLDLDVAAFLLRKVAVAARRLMMEIHELASAYGWSEAAITSMTAARRAAYLEIAYERSSGADGQARLG
jgi:hypothetical protein